MDNKELAQGLLNKIIGFQPTRIKLGYGSFMTIDIGKDIIKEVKTRKGTDTICFGEWYFWVYMCAWRIDKNGVPFVGSDDERSITQERLLALDGKKITDIRVLNNAFDVVFSFEDNFELSLFSFNTEEKEQWMFYTPDNKVFVAGPGSKGSFGDSSKS